MNTFLWFFSQFVVLYHGSHTQLIPKVPTDASSLLPLLITAVVYHLFSERIKFTFTPGPLYVLFPLPGMLFPQMFALFIYQLRSHLREASPITLHPIAQSDFF